MLLPQTCTATAPAFGAATASPGLRASHIIHTSATCAFRPAAEVSTSTHRRCCRRSQRRLRLISAPSSSFLTRRATPLLPGPHWLPFLASVAASQPPGPVRRLWPAPSASLSSHTFRRITFARILTLDPLITYPHHPPTALSLISLPIHLSHCLPLSISSVDKLLCFHCSSIIGPNAGCTSPRLHVRRPAPPLL